MEIEPWREQICDQMHGISNIDSLPDSLQTLSHLLSTHPTGCSLTVFCEDFSAARRYFISGSYEELLYKLLEKMADIELMSKVGKLISQFFVKGIADISFEVLCAGLSEKYGLLTNETCVNYLTQLVSTNQISQIMNSKCSTDTYMFNGEHNSLVQALASLPDRVANRLGRNVPETLRRDAYYSVLYRDILSGLQYCKERVEKASLCSVVFLSQLIGKLCLDGLGMKLWPVLLANIMVSHDFLISRVFHKVVVGIELKALDATITPLLRCIHHHQDVSALLGNTIIDTKRLEHLLLDKLLLQKYYTTEDVPKLLHNIIGYIASSPTRIHFYYSLFSRLLSVWSDSSSIRHTSFDQHMYISKAIVICAAFLQTGEENWRGTIMRTLMNGLQNHLSSSDSSVRQAGMAVAELVSEKINPKLEAKLKFEYDEMGIYDELKAVMTLPTAPCVGAYQSSQTVDNNGLPKRTREASDLDSDDDLQPIGQFEDKARPKEKAPAYVGDCMQGLMDEENPERVETCLKSACKLIRMNSAMTMEVAVEFTKILTHMGCTLAINNYMYYRQQSLVSLLVVSPVSVANYLCREFSSRNYNVRQRLDMLDALAVAAMELSNPVSDKEKTSLPLVVDMASLNVQDESEEPNWKRVVEERIKSKTRRFASASAPTPQGSANKFAAVAGHFFFPLLAASQVGLGEHSPLSEDSILLVQYLYTLGKVMGSAQFCPLAPRMALELMDLLWMFRGSAEPSVRKAAVFCIAMTVLAIPPSVMLDDRYHMTDTVEYLRLLMERDADPELQEMASKVLSFLQHQLSLGLQEASKQS
ncbi:telomere length regulation protein TEL2 homolog isoform X2 [Watersipora subatra]|uniref:telomere length regulation protein TEL2 homolog isoform X2 n=1 Tax=Watersipora subatra TaxID=2589382 RepID=UPI00355B0D2C